MPLDGFETVDTGCPEYLQKKAVKFVLWLKNERRKVSADEIVRIGKLRDKVQVRAMIAWLRAQGRADLSRIASDDSGYWWSDDRAACIGGVAHLRQRARQIMRAYNGVEKAFESDDQRRLL